jgi:cytoskeletal protein RodZ
MTETIGQQLKNARLARQMELEQVSKSIHVRLHYLQALENDDRAALPSEVQGRGFLRLYAGFLDLPVQQLLSQWERPSTESPENLPPVVEKKAAPSSKFELKKPVKRKSEAALEQTAVAETSQPEPEQKVEPEPKLDEPVQPVFVSARPIQPEIDDTSASQQILKGIGLELRNQREHLGLKLEDVERFTHVRLHYLQALESGQLDSLPSPVQGRGMLSNYAHFLELDTENLLLRFADALQSRRLERSPQNTAPAPKHPPKAVVQASGIRRFLTPDLIIGSSVILLLVVFAIWGAAQISSMRKAEVRPTAMDISELVLTGTPVLQGTPTASPTAESASNGAQGSNQTSPQETSTIPVIGDDPLQVYVVANQRAWMRVSQDDTVKFEGRVSPGNAYTFSAKQSIELVTGNAAALAVFYNQMDLGSLGGVGQVARLQFTQAGIITPTSQFSPTPSLTPMLTITPSPSPTVPSPTVTIYVP